MGYSFPDFSLLKDKYVFVPLTNTLRWDKDEFDLISILGPWAQSIHGKHNEWGSWKTQWGKQSTQQFTLRVDPLLGISATLTETGKDLTEELVRIVSYKLWQKRTPAHHRGDSDIEVKK